MWYYFFEIVRNFFFEIIRNFFFYYDDYLIWHHLCTMWIDVSVVVSALHSVITGSDPSEGDHGIHSLYKVETFV